MKSIKGFIKFRHRIAACLLAFVLLLSGCSNAGSAPLKEIELLPTPTPSPQPAQGGTLEIPIPRNPLKSASGTDVQANPLLVNTEEMFNMYWLVYEPLLRCDGTNQLIPSLAEKWESDETGRVWTISLRKGVNWHMIDRTLTADDVLYTLEQIKDLGSDSYYSAANDAIESAEKIDDHTLRITMNQPGTSSLYALIFPVICEQTVDNTLIGTGPYRVKNSSDTRIELIVNDQWWKQQPYIQNITCMAKENNEVALASLEAGQLNFVPTSVVSVGKYRDEGVTSVVDVMTQDAEMLLINHENAILSDTAVRKALVHALNRSALVSNVYMNRATICDVPIPTDSFLYSPSTKVYDYNVNTAAQYLQQAGWIDIDEDGVLERKTDATQELKLRLLVSESTENTYRKSAAALMQAQLAQVGIVLEIETAKLTIGTTDSDFAKKLQDGDFDLALAGFRLSENGDLTPYLKQDGSRNYGSYHNTIMENLLDKAVKAVGEKQMQDAYALVQEQFIQDVPFIMLYFRLNSVICSADINNLTDVREPDLMRTVDKWHIMQ